MRYATLLFLLLSAVPAQASQWQVQGSSEFTFAVTFEGVDTLGRFKRFDVMFDFDPANPATGHLRVSVDLSGADMGDADLNAGIADPNWFDLDNFSKAVFDSKRIEARTPGEFVATGVLNLKGISKTVAVPFAWSEKGRHADMHGEFVLQRIDFNIGSGEWASSDPIGIEVKLRFDLSLESGD